MPRCSASSNAQAPTLLVDEVDAVFGKKSPREELRGILNAGYRQGATVHRMGGSNNTELQTFSVFCPKVFAGIGECLPDTISDRAIPISLRRRIREATIERFRLRDVQPAGDGLRDRLTAWLEPQHDYLRDCRPALPDELDDRAQDVWEPLLAIVTSLAATGRSGHGGHARAVHRRGTRGRVRERAPDPRHRAAFERKTSTHQDVRPPRRPHQIEESPWGEWYGKPLSSHALSKLLKLYRIRTMAVWADGKTVHGYKLGQFSDAFAQVGVSGVSSVRGDTTSHEASNAPNASNASTSELAPVAGDDDFLEHLFTAFENNHVTEGEWSQADHLHRLLAPSDRAAA